MVWHHKIVYHKAPCMQAAWGWVLRKISSNLLLFSLYLPQGPSNAPPKGRTATQLLHQNCNLQMPKPRCGYTAANGSYYIVSSEECFIAAFSIELT